VDAVLPAARRSLARRPSDGRLRRLVATLAQTVHGTQRLLAQTAQRLAGQRTIADRMVSLVSLADPDEVPDPQGQAQGADRVRLQAARGRGRPRVVADHRLEQGNPPDAPQLLPAVARVMRLTGRVPATVAADRGFGTAANERAIERAIADLGVQRDGLHRKGRPSAARAAYQATRAFRRLRTWRVGIEARISHLKRGFGLRRTRLRRLGGARTWVGLGIFADNLQRMTVIAAAT
jgi:transposase, IS5 family